MPSRSGCGPVVSLEESLLPKKRRLNGVLNDSLHFSVPEARID